MISQKCCGQFQVVLGDESDESDGSGDDDDFFVVSDDDFDICGDDKYQAHEATSVSDISKETPLRFTRQRFHVFECMFVIRMGR